LPSNRFGPGESGHLVVGVVPRHDAQQHADRTAADHRAALAAEQFDRFVGEELRGVVGVELIDRSAEFHLADRLVQRLAHLALDDRGQLVLAFLVQLGDATDQGGALVDGRLLRPLPICRAGRGEGLLYLLVGGGGVFLDDVAGRRVDHRVHGMTLNRSGHRCILH
jgi:hypothetical protein